ncbi:DUF2752 domain-containing protein [Yinghuangia sp. ASG 101]|nr:DUF2752 domain-containing protein [Yinghuangia sp. ASG 101]UGQ10101.1 DUF2752 domain-containing protein [Yinghuangia sp. ASG 101]
MTGATPSGAAGPEGHPRHDLPPAAVWPRVPSEAPAPAGTLAQRLLAPAGTALGAAGAAAYVAVVDPGRPGHYPTCPFFAVTGLFCPGCGGLRCAHALAHGDVVSALALNAFAVAMVPLIVCIWLRWTVRSLRGRTRTTAADPRLIRVLVAAIVVFAVARNLPFGGALAP